MGGWWNWPVLWDNLIISYHCSVLHSVFVLAHLPSNITQYYSVVHLTYMSQCTLYNVNTANIKNLSCKLFALETDPHIWSSVCGVGEVSLLKELHFLPLRATMAKTRTRSKTTLQHYPPANYQLSSYFLWDVKLSFIIISFSDLFYCPSYYNQDYCSSKINKLFT